MITNILAVTASIYTVQGAACCIIHVLNNTKEFPKSKSVLLFKHLNLPWVLFNLKTLRS